MRAFAFSLCLLLPSCGLFARTFPDLEIPTADAQVVVNHSSQLPNFDINQDGIIDSAEFDTFITWFITKVSQEFIAPVPGPRAPTTPATQPGTQS